MGRSLENRGSRPPPPPPRPGKSQVAICFLWNAGMDTPQEATGPLCPITSRGRSIEPLWNMLNTFKKKIQDPPDEIFWIRSLYLRSFKIPYSKNLCSTMPYLPNPTQETRSPDLPRFLKYKEYKKKIKICWLLLVSKTPWFNLWVCHSELGIFLQNSNQYLLYPKFSEWSVLCYWLLLKKRYIMQAKFEQIRLKQRTITGGGGGGG